MQVCKKGGPLQRLFRKDRNGTKRRTNAKYWRTIL